MDNLDKYIDNLFEQKLSSASLPGAVNGANWLKIGKVLQKKAFLKFSVAKFNIYYLSSLVLATTTAGAILLPPVFTKNEVENIKAEPSIILVDSLTVPDTLPVNADTFYVEPATPFVECKEQVKVETVVVKEPIESIQIESETAVDSIQVDTLCRNGKVPELEQIETTIQESLVPVTQSDTIFQVDTVKITKKKLKLRRSK